MKLFKQFSLKSRGFMEMLTRPATEEERIGERNSRILGWIMLAGLIALLLVGVGTVGKNIISWVS